MGQVRAKFESQRTAILPLDESASAAKYGRLSSRRSGDFRRQSRRDRDKILYSQAWRRLAGVTQVISPDGEDLVLHTRLTHSEKVSQVAHSITTALLERDDRGQAKLIAELGGIDIDMVEASALAHDLGHPPFGHLGETVLDETAVSWGLDNGYEGNAQTFRILTRLSRWSQYSTGLSLSPGTLAAVLKYPWTRGAAGGLVSLGSERVERLRKLKNLKNGPSGLYWSKFGAYETESQQLEHARSWLPEVFRQRGNEYSQTLEASIMDVADDITYAIHDLEDFISAGFVHVDEISHEFQAGDRKASENIYDHVEVRLRKKYPDYFCASAWGEATRWFSNLFSRLQALTASSTAEGSLEKAMANFVSDLLDQFIPAVQVHPEPLWDSGPFIGLSKQEWHQVHLLKEFTMRFVVNTPGVTAQQISSRRLLESVAADMLSWVRQNDMSRGLPLELRSKIAWFERDDAQDTGASQSAESVERLLIDYLAGLTDHAARSLYARLNPSGADQIFGLAVL